MRTRRSRGLKQTRKGGKDTKDNHSNWERYWRKSYPEYDPMTNYPGFYKTYVKQVKDPNEFKKLTTPNTYIIQRHGFSCANLKKAKDKKSWHFRVADPSLTAYGIYSLLRNQSKPEGFDGTIFVSSLIRTWQTGILEYGRYGPLTIIVSPYIKEKHGILGDLSNMPLPFEQQMAQMGEFMTFLKGIENPIAKEITDHKHEIVYMDKAYPLTYAVLGREDKPYVHELKHKKIFMIQKSTKPTLTEEVFIPEISVIPHPSLHEYYGAKGFVYFDHWVRKEYPQMNTIFVVSHSKWMQKVIEEYWGVLGTTIFDENAWKLKITPGIPGKFKFEIIRGIIKPKQEELDLMDPDRESTCYIVPRPWPRPQPLITDSIQHTEQFSEESDVENERYQNLASDDPPESGLDELIKSDASEPEVKQDPTPFPRLVIPPPKLISPDDPRRTVRYTPKLVSQRPRAESLPSEADPLLHTEVIPVVSKVKTVLVTNEKTKVITRSYSELETMLRDSTIQNGLIGIMVSNTDFKTKVMNYVYSNPYVMVSDPTDTSYFKRKVPIYLFENHYLVFILLCKPYYEELIDVLSHSTIVSTILRLTKLTIPVMVTFLKELRQLIENDSDFYHLLLSKCTKNANQHYAFKEHETLKSFTLLDLFLYELDAYPVTKDTIDFMYKCIIDLVRNGARYSSVYAEIPAAWTIKMPIVELELLPGENEILQTWEREKRGIDPDGILSKYQDRYTDAKRKLQVEERKLQAAYNKAKYDFAQLEKIQDGFFEKNKALFADLEQIKKEYLATKARVDPNNRILMARKEMHRKFDQAIYSYLNPILANHLSDDPAVTKMHNEFFQKILKPELGKPYFSIGGSRGTSWKRTSLRQSSVKGGRYRASLYKGKRRTRANRS